MIATANIKNNVILYDQHNWKQEFLDEINEATAKSYARIFGITAGKEEDKRKDINAFTLEELEEILFDFQANNRNTIESYARIISSYLNWSVQRGYSKKNPLADLRPDDFEKYLTNEEEYLPERKIRRYEGDCVNAQDAVILRLLFIGVGGKQMSEIRNLKKKDVDKTNKRLRLVNSLKEDDMGMPIKESIRYLDIDDRTLNLIEKAIGQTTYTKKNGEMEENKHMRSFTDLVSNDYVIRASITKTDECNAPVDKFVIYRRLQVLAETLGIDGLTAKYIQRSGMMYYANQMIEGEQELALDDLKIIADRFNMKSYHNLKGFLNVENVRRTYPTNN